MKFAVGTPKVEKSCFGLIPSGGMFVPEGTDQIYLKLYDNTVPCFEYEATNGIVSCGKAVDLSTGRIINIRNDSRVFSVNGTLHLEGKEKNK